MVIKAGLKQISSFYKVFTELCEKIFKTFVFQNCKELSFQTTSHKSQLSSAITLRGTRAIVIVNLSRQSKSLGEFWALLSRRENSGAVCTSSITAIRTSKVSSLIADRTSSQSRAQSIREHHAAKSPAGPRVKMLSDAFTACVNLAFMVAVNSP